MLMKPPPSLSPPSSPQQEPFVEDLNLNLGNRSWMSLDVISTLLSFSDTPLYAQARQIFELGVVKCPEVSSGGGGGSGIERGVEGQQTYEEERG